MQREVSTLEIAMIAECTERNVQRWIAENKLPAQHIRDNVYRIDSEDLERLRLGKHYREVRALQRQVAELQEHIEALEGQLHALRSARKPLKTQDRKSISPSTQKASTAIVAPSEGLVPGRPFAAAHGVEKASETAFKRQSVRTIKVEGDQAHYLDEELRLLALRYWHEHRTPGFHECDDPECPCHSLVSWR